MQKRLTDRGPAWGGDFSGPKDHCLIDESPDFSHEFNAALATLLCLLGGILYWPLCLCQVLFPSQQTAVES